MNPEYLLPIEDTPINISQMGLYPKYKTEAVKLHRLVETFENDFIDSAMDLYNERLLEDGNIPDINDIVCTIHADEVYECCGNINLH